MTSFGSAVEPLAAPRQNDAGLEAVATISRRDFARAQASIPGFAADADYDDWLDDRYGLVVGLCSSGVDARLVPVSLPSFLAWCRFAGIDPSEPGLDEFATAVALIDDKSRDQCDVEVVANVTPAEFAAHFAKVEAFHSAGDYDAWTTHRRSALSALAASGKIALESTTSIEGFLAWARCLGAASSEKHLDVYASLAVEAFADGSIDADAPPPDRSTALQGDRSR